MLCAHLGLMFRRKSRIEPYETQSFCALKQMDIRKVISRNKYFSNMYFHLSNFTNYMSEYRGLVINISTSQQLGPSFKFRPGERLFLLRFSLVSNFFRFLQATGFYLLICFKITIHNHPFIYPSTIYNWRSSLSIKETHNQYNVSVLIL
jgi:hypothetical protein